MYHYTNVSKFDIIIISMFIFNSSLQKDVFFFIFFYLFIFVYVGKGVVEHTKDSQEFTPGSAPRDHS